MTVAAPASMPESNLMIVDCSLEDYVMELSQYIDYLEGRQTREEFDAAVSSTGPSSISKETGDGAEPAKPELKSGSFALYTSELMALGEKDGAKQDEVFQAIAERSVILHKAPEREFEPAYNLVLHILTLSRKFDTILPTLLSNLTGHTPTFPNGPTTVMSVLTSLFNLLHAADTNRFTVFSAIVDYGDAKGQLRLLADQVHNVPGWLATWQVADPGAFCCKLATSLVKIAETRKAYDLLLSAVTRDPVSSPLASTQDVALQLVNLALDMDHLYNLDEVLDSQVIKQAVEARDPALYRLVTIVAQGDLDGLCSLPVSERTARLTRKTRVLALARLASATCYGPGERRNFVTYDEIASQLHVKSDEVEHCVIDAIRAGLVEGRLSQTNRIFEIRRAVTVGDFGMDEWRRIQSRVHAWKSSVASILESIHNAKETSLRDRKKMAI